MRETSQSYECYPVSRYIYKVYIIYIVHKVYMVCSKYSIRRIMMDAQYNFEGKLSSSAVSLLWALLYEIVKQNTEKTEKEHDSV